MLISAELIAFAAALVLSLLGTGLWRRGAQRLGMIDQPGSRSSHGESTTTAGGLVMVSLIVACALWFALDGMNDSLIFGAAIAGMMLLGLWDDAVQSSRRLRIAVQLVTVIFLVAFLPQANAWWLIPLGVVGLVWCINLFNFMDGIDGLAGVQAITFVLGWQFLAGWLPEWPGVWIAWCSGALLGFLAWNWSPAKLFMGDTGSLALGILIGGLIWYGYVADRVSPTGSMILLVPFWYDASVTLLKRLFRGENIAQAHREHLYQIWARRTSHQRVTCVVLAINLAWCWPVSWLSDDAWIAGDLASALGWMALALVPFAGLSIYTARTEWGAEEFEQRAEAVIETGKDNQ